MSNLLIKIGFWIASKGLNDLSQDQLTVSSAAAFRTKIIDFIIARYQKAQTTKSVTADDRFWWWWAQVMKSNRLTALSDAKKNGN